MLELKIVIVLDSFQELRSFYMTSKFLLNSEEMDSGISNSHSQHYTPVSSYFLPLYELTVVTNGSGTVAVDPPVGPYLTNTLVTLTATPTQDWLFVGWTGAVSTASNTINLVMDEAKTVYAVFEPIPIYALNVVDDGGGTVDLNPPGGTYLSNTVVTLTGAEGVRQEM